MSYKKNFYQNICQWINKNVGMLSFYKVPINSAFIYIKAYYRKKRNHFKDHSPHLPCTLLSEMRIISVLSLLLLNLHSFLILDLRSLLHFHVMQLLECHLINE